ncbi:MAG: NHL/RHS/YD repeat protein [Microgenomates group bacterium GW2011_GWC1_37_8]|nr:MAG: NHL/RHS/YD repeat protein [Microgenomates group bacterium GW2011_GWC1_37_8]
MLVVGLFAFASDVDAAETLYYIHQDHLGSTSLVTDGTGEAVSKQTYYPYGATRSQTSDVGSKKLERQYTGQISDTEETGLYYYNARYYNPQIAKFTQADSADTLQNRYVYVGGNPINLIDPTGNYKCQVGYRCSEIKYQDYNKIKITAEGEKLLKILGLEDTEQRFRFWAYNNGFFNDNYQSNVTEVLDAYHEADYVYYAGMYLTIAGIPELVQTISTKTNSVTIPFFLPENIIKAEIFDNAITAIYSGFDPDMIFSSFNLGPTTEIFNIPREKQIRNMAKLAGNSPFIIPFKIHSTIEESKLTDRTNRAEFINTYEMKTIDSLYQYENEYPLLYPITHLSREWLRFDINFRTNYINSHSGE